MELSRKHDLRIIAGTDTHCLNKTHESGRMMLQRGKNVRFDNEENWDLKFKTYRELCDAYISQGVLTQEEYLEAINNTNVVADMVEAFEVNTDIKYPKIYENPYETFKQKIYKKAENHPYLYKNHSHEEVEKVLEQELDVYNKTKSTEFMLLQDYLRDWEKSNGIYCGYGRGSVSGSLAAYTLGITEMDSIRFDLNFFRFLNPARVTNADIDSDYKGEIEIR